MIDKPDKATAQLRRHVPRALPQRGAALLIALLMLTATMLLGVSAAQLSLMNEKSSRNDRDRHIAFQAAESALRDAARDLAGSRVRVDAFPTEPGNCHANGVAAGLCLSAVGTPAWPSGLASAALAYGRFSGYTFPHDAALLPAAPPRYVIELLRLTGPGTSPVTALRYRVTALGFGVHAHTRVILQTVHDADVIPPRQLSWREISHWQH